LKKLFGKKLYRFGKFWMILGVFFDVNSFFVRFARLHQCFGTGFRTVGMIASISNVYRAIDFLNWRRVFFTNVSSIAVLRSRSTHSRPQYLIYLKELYQDKV